MRLHHRDRTQTYKAGNSNNGMVERANDTIKTGTINILR